MSDNQPLLGQWAAITGASKGIGHGIATEFVSAGAHVVMVARGRETLDAACDELRSKARPNQKVVSVVADTSDPAAIDKLFETLGAEVDELNIFVANAGTGRVIPFLELSQEVWDETLALNLTGTFLCCQRAARMMADGPPDTNKAILVVSSIRARGVRPGRVAYAVTKAGVNQLVRAAAYELAPLGIRVNILSPGITATPLAVEGNPEVFAEMTATVPMGRAGTTADMGAAALYLCSPAARFVTGAEVVVDGGESLR
jgi:NAD(P)-dependent dehydrogenase (short-subunit alcohol dehydrogenase family)